MDLRAKQRLTGAVILVALFVLLVPELLTGPGDAKPAADSADTEGLREYTIDIDGQGPAAPSAPQPAQDAAVNLPAPAESASVEPGRAVPGEAAAPSPSPVSPPPAPSPATPATTNPMAAAPMVAPSPATEP